jgi:hypothetical protein
MQGLDRPLRLAWRDQVLQSRQDNSTFPDSILQRLDRHGTAFNRALDSSYDGPELLISADGQKPQASIGRVNLGLSDLAARISPYSRLEATSGRLSLDKANAGSFERLKAYWICAQCPILDEAFGLKHVRKRQKRVA